MNIIGEIFMGIVTPFLYIGSNIANYFSVSPLLGDYTFSLAVSVFIGLFLFWIVLNLFKKIGTTWKVPLFTTIFLVITYPVSGAEFSDPQIFLKAFALITIFGLAFISYWWFTD